MRNLEGKGAMIFAGSRGIGRATAKRLAAEGAQVGVGYAGNAEAAETTVTEIGQSGGRAFAFQADVSDRDQVVSAFQKAENTLGQLDIVINAAAISKFAPLAEIAKEDVEKSLAINVRGAFNVLQEAANRVSNGGRIIQFATGGTKMPMAGGGVYAGTKAAGEHMALALAKELGEREVTVNVISPGTTDTDGLIMPEEQVDALIEQTPLGRLGQPEDVADVVAFLASGDARWVTGQNIQANGGIL